ncbi:hypothetical protein BGZ52_009553 [Haplosporangium bisporale]|nr:hypothetical protein BGZ52_009553 [Haplosporangium bisporale]
MLGLLGINTGKVTSSPFFGLFRVVASPVRFSFQALYLSLAKVVWEDEEDDFDNTEFEDPADFDRLNI